MPQSDISEKISGAFIQVASGCFVKANISGNIVSISGAVAVSGVVSIISGIVSIGSYSYWYGSGALVTTVNSGATVLHTVNVSYTGSGYCKITDGSAGGVVFSPSLGYYELDAQLLSGLTVNTLSGTAWNLCVTYR